MTEEHTCTGGAAGTVAEFLMDTCEAPLPRLLRLAVPLENPVGLRARAERS